MSCQALTYGKRIYINLIATNIIDAHRECKSCNPDIPIKQRQNHGGRNLSIRSKKQLSLHVLKKFRIIYGSVRQHFREVEQSCGVTGSQLWIMQEVANTPGIGVSDLAEKLSIHQSTCSQLVEKLASRKLVIKERNDRDQRRVGLHLTNEAAKLIMRAPSPAQGVLPEALWALSAETMQTLDASLEKVVEQLQIRDDKLAEKPLSDL